MLESDYKVVMKTSLNKEGLGICLSTSTVDLSVGQYTCYVTHEFNMIAGKINRFTGNYFDTYNSNANQIYSMMDYSERAIRLFKFN